MFKNIESLLIMSPNDVIKKIYNSFTVGSLSIWKCFYDQELSQHNDISSRKLFFFLRVTVTNKVKILISRVYSGLFKMKRRTGQKLSCEYLKLCVCITQEYLFILTAVQVFCRSCVMKSPGTTYVLHPDRSTVQNVLTCRKQSDRRQCFCVGETGGGNMAWFWCRGGQSIRTRGFLHVSPPSFRHIDD